MKSDSRVHYLIIALIVLLSLVGGFLVLYCTNWGPWAKGDSVEYIEAARNLINGRGLVLVGLTGDAVPLTIRPPFYSTLLGLMGFFRIDLLVAARSINVFLFVVFILSLGFSAYYFTNQPVLSVLLVVFILTSPVFILNYTGVMAEPLFFSLGILSLVLLVPYFQKGKSLILIISATLGGLAMLSRFSGVTIVATGFVAIALFVQRDLKYKVWAFAKYVSFSLVFLLFWTFKTLRAGNSVGKYDFGMANLWERSEPIRAAFVQVAWDWLPVQHLLSASYRTRLIIILSIFVLFSAIISSLFVIAFRNPNKHTARRFLHDRCFQLGAIFTLLAVIYTAFIVFAYLFISEPKTALIERILSPILIGALVGYCSLYIFAVKALGSRRLFQIFIVVVVLSGIASNTYRGLNLIADLHENGLGYTSRKWQGSEVIPTLMELPEGVPLISNDVEVIMFYTGRSAYRITELENKTPLEVFDTFGENEFDDVQMIFRRDAAALILFSGKFWKFQDIYGWEAENRLRAFTKGLYKYFEGSDGAIYFYHRRSP